MLTGIIGILGALAGFIPSILQFFSLKANNEHAIRLRQLEIEATKAGVALQVDLEHARADTEQQRNVYNYASAPSGIKWVDALAVFVRPYITLIMFHAWIGLEVMLLLYGIANGVTFETMVSNLWDADVKSLFAAIIGFWFGDRGAKRVMAATLSITQPAPVQGAAISPPPAPVQPHGSGRVIPAPAGDRPGF